MRLSTSHYRVRVHEVRGLVVSAVVRPECAPGLVPSTTALVLSSFHIVWRSRTGGSLASKIVVINDDGLGKRMGVGRKAHLSHMLGLGVIVVGVDP